MQTGIIIYLTVINIVTVIMFGVDKWRAVSNHYRISEKHLYIVMGLGGIAGALIGMQLFSHKTIKSSFMIRFAGITMVRVIILIISQII